MKKLLLTAMITALLVLPMGSVALAVQEAPAPEDDILQEVDFVPGDVPAETGVLESVTPAVHAVLLAMLNHDMTALEPSADLNWEILYNMLSLYGQMDDRCEVHGEQLVLPAEIVSDFSTALVPGFDLLAPVPEALADRMVYDAEIDSYLLTCGSDSLAEVRMNSAMHTGGNLQVTGSLVYLVDGTDLVQFQATLQPQDNMFGYTVTALDLL